MSRRTSVTFAGSEAANAVVTAGLYDQGAQVDRSIDLVAVLNHNAADLTFDFSDDNGATYPTQEAVTGLTATDTLLVVSPAAIANKARLTIAATQTPGEAKRVGLLLLARLLLQPTVELGSFEPMVQSGQQLDRMGNNSLRTSYQYYADDDYVIKDYHIGFEAITRAQLREFEDNILHAKENLLFWPFPGDLPDEVGLVSVDAKTWRYRPTNKTFLGSGWDLDFILRGVGAA